jgi:hypothetical protein
MTALLRMPIGPTDNRRKLLILAGLTFAALC